jgi:preprotein translocase subunit SecY
MIFRSFLLNQENLLNRIKVTLGIVLLVRFGNFLAIPGVDQIYFSNELKNSALFTTFRTLLQGDSFLLSVFTLGILPNLNASIAIQLISSVFPPLKRLTKEGGELGQKKVTQYTRYLTALIAFQYSIVIAFAIKPYVFGWDFNRAAFIAITLLTGSIIMLWLSEIINEKGLGNGVSVLIFVNIISAVPSALISFTATTSFPTKILTLLIFLLGITITVIVQDATRQIPTISLKGLAQESENVKERFLAFRLNPSGIMPLILSSSLINLVGVGFNNLKLPEFLLNFSGLVYLSGYFFLTLFFSYFYSTITLNPIELAKDLRKKGSKIPSVAPGLQTMKFLQEIITRISLLGGLFLATIVTIPSLLALTNTNLPTFPGIGGTSLIILAGVAVDLSRQIRTYSIFGSYDNIDSKDL